jgi:hypothetical protein
MYEFQKYSVVLSNYRLNKDVIVNESKLIQRVGLLFRVQVVSSAAPTAPAKGPIL